MLPSRTKPKIREPRGQNRLDVVRVNGLDFRHHQDLHIHGSAIVLVDGMIAIQQIPVPQSVQTSNEKVYSEDWIPSRHFEGRFAS